MVIIAQAESRAEQRSLECSVSAMMQVIESKQKRVASLTKLLEIPGMEESQRAKILDKVMELMGEIEQEENVLHEASQNKRAKSDLVEMFLKVGASDSISNKENSTAAGSLEVTPRLIAFE